MVTEPVRSAVISGVLDGQRLDRVVALAVDVSRSVARSLVEDGAVRIDGRVITVPSQRVASGSTLEVTYEPEPPVRMDPDPTVPLEVVYDDAHVIVVNKPAGVIVHPGSGHAGGTLVNGLLARYPELAEVGDRVRPGVVHRLDAGTTGLLVVARTSVAHERLVAELSAHEVRREYRLLCVGVIEPPAGVIDAPIGRSPRDPTAMAVVADGRPARTRYRRLARADAVSLVACELETGRTHQIRVHLQAHGFPVLGDRRYGGGGPMPELDRPLLHAAVLAFEHPVSGERLRFSAPDPVDMVEVCRSLGLDGAEHNG